MTMTDTEYGHETDEYRQRLAHDLHKIDGLPLAAVADEFNVSLPEIQNWIATYIARSDAAAAATQPPLFE
ncbi:hypothetical protein RND64_20630 [Gordonia sp. w5E2]|uniref:Transposase n=3 Tax=Gordonia TaxID=2053 RepID=L7KQJ3_9ACTN|nr:MULTISPECIES: hypothetical protein [Gordonia]UEA57382.1 hypothetical protein LK459_12095 [Gordonia otitidis]GAC51120.1 hypothetical protein GOACH_48_00050 [Gordonia aichiensis NBRC 108223]SKZ60365.1 Uncharacterised protein [Mycobacteroides abscessus subsp. abscessus]